MDVYAKLAEIRQVVEQARALPMSASAVVNRVDLLQRLDDLEEMLTLAFTDAHQLISDRESVFEEGRQGADQIVREAHDEREVIVSDAEVLRVATRQAAAVLDQAQAESRGLRMETDDYVDGKLATFEITLGRTMEAVTRGRERLAGRTEMDALTEDEADKIELPEHLEG